jgi:hypothetical protein
MMIQLAWFVLLPLIIRCCTIDDVLSRRNSTDVIFTGRILSLHRWSIEHSYSTFVSLNRILQGEQHLLEHYQWTELQHPLYVIVDQLPSCTDSLPLKYYEMRIFGIRIEHARFYASFAPLTITVANMKAIDGKISSFSYSSAIVSFACFSFSASLSLSPYLATFSSFSSFLRLIKYWTKINRNIMHFNFL